MEQLKVQNMSLFTHKDINVFLVFHYPFKEKLNYL